MDPAKIGAEAVVEALKARVSQRGVRARVAHELGFTVQGISQVVNGRRPPTAREAAALGFRKVIRYERAE